MSFPKRIGPIGNATGQTGILTRRTISTFYTDKHYDTCKCKTLKSFLQTIEHHFPNQPGVFINYISTSLNGHISDCETCDEAVCTLQTCK